MALPTPSEKLNASLNLRDIRDVNVLNRGLDKDDPLPTDTDMINGKTKAQFIDMLRAAIESVGTQSERSKVSRKQNLWSIEEIGSQLFNFLKGGSPMSVKEDSVKRIENTYGEKHSADSRMKEGIEYIPVPEYNASPNAIIRLLRARSAGAGQQRKA